jgi:hypothetical protein
MTISMERIGPVVTQTVRIIVNTFRIKTLKAYDVAFSVIKLIRHGNMKFERITSFDKLPAETMSVDIIYNHEKQEP